MVRPKEFPSQKVIYDVVMARSEQLKIKVKADVVYDSVGEAHKRPTELISREQIKAAPIGTCAVLERAKTITFLRKEGSGKHSLWVPRTLLGELRHGGYSDESLYTCQITEILQLLDVTHGKPEERITE